MKKFLSIFFVFGLALNAQAGISTGYSTTDASYNDYKKVVGDMALKQGAEEESNTPVMSVSQFEEYKDAVEYLECKHQGRDFCDGYNSVGAAKKYVDSLKGYDVPGYSKAEKNILDVKMVTISKDMDEFGNFTSTAGVDNRALATSNQLSEYEKAVNYLVCIYSDADECSGFSSPDAARKYAQDLKENYTAAGLNASKKRNLDGKSEDLLPLISIEEAQDFAAYLAKLSPSQYVDEMHDTATVKTTHKMPGEDTLAAAESGNYNGEDLNKDMESTTSTLTKEEFAEQVQVDASVVQPYTSAPAYLKNIETTKQIENNTSYDLSSDKKQALVVSHQVQEAPGMSMKKEMYSTVFLRRYKEFGYALKVEKQEVEATSEIDPSVFSEDKLPVIEIELPATVVDYNTMDSGWEDRYAEVEAVDAEERKIDGNFMMLEYAVDISERLRDKADQLKEEAMNPTLTENQKQAKLDEAEKAELEATQALKDSRQYYDNLGSYTHVDKVRAIRTRYLSAM
jgi:hypothetical protein